MTFVTIPTAPGGSRPTFVYFSKRGIPLVYNAPPPPPGKLIVTTENYLKWYDLYAIDTMGNVSVFDPQHELVEVWDHNFHPAQLEALRYTGNGRGDEIVLDEEAFEMIVGRFITENRRLRVNEDGDVVPAKSAFAECLGLDTVSVDN